MRVVQLLTQAEGGPAVHAADVAAGLARRGHDSHVVGPASPETPRARAAGVTWHERCMAHKTDARGAGRVVAALRELSPDVLHLQDRRAGMLGRLLGPAAGRPGVVYTLHGVADGLSDLVAGNVRAAPRRRRDTLYYLQGERWLARLGGRVVVPSAAVADFATGHVGLPAHVVDVVPNGVDPQRYRPADADPGPGASDVVWVGGLVPVKRPDLLVEAVAALPGVTATMVGDGPLTSEVDRLRTLLGVADRVRTVGRRADPAADLLAARVYALTSVAENCPLALLQAMASGLPVVAPAVGGVPEVVRNGVEGLLFPAGDGDALREALQRLLDRPDLREQYGRAARARVLECFTLEHCLDDLERTYAEVVRER